MDKTEIEKFDITARKRGEYLMDTWSANDKPATIGDLERSHQSLSKMISWIGGLLQKMEKNVSSLEERLHENEQRINSHIEVYAKNNKDLALLNEKIVTLNKTLDSHIENGEVTSQKLIISIDKFSIQLNAVEQKINSFNPETLSAMSSAYNGILTTKNLIVGFSSVILGVSAIGAGFIWLVRHSL